jgi:hypothetical protein
MTLGTPDIDGRAIFHQLFVSIASPAAFIDLHISKT